MRGELHPKLASMVYRHRQDKINSYYDGFFSQSDKATPILV